MFDEHGNYINEEDVVNNQVENDGTNSVEENSQNQEQSFLVDDTNNNSNGGNFNADTRNNGDSNGYTGYNGYSSYRGYYNQNSNYDNKGGKNKKWGFIFGGVAVASIMFFVGGAILVNSLSQGSSNAILNPEQTTTAGDSKEYLTIEQTNDSSYKDNINKTDEGNKTAAVYITDVSDVVKDVMPSIVAITSRVNMHDDNSIYGDWYDYYGYGDEDGQDFAESGAGSGIIVKQTKTELLIVTNNHVVEGADELAILFNDGKSVMGDIKATNETADIAIVAIPLEKIEESTLKEIKIARIGDSNKLNVGEGVIAIGNALGYGQSVTTGVISAKDRAIKVDNREMIVLQTDAAINGGNSGGALLNSDGQVIGINVAKYSSSSYGNTASIEGMGFAIPISSATDIIENLMNKQTRKVVDKEERGALGIVGRTLDASTAMMYEIPAGVLVSEIVEGGAAQKAGMQRRDIITAFDDQEVSTIDALVEKLTYYKAGEEVEVKFSRQEGGEYVEKTVKVKLLKAQTQD